MKNMAVLMTNTWIMAIANLCNQILNFVKSQTDQARYNENDDKMTKTSTLRLLQI